jgi:hypothetical protein
MLPSASKPASSVEETAARPASAVLEAPSPAETKVSAVTNATSP